MNIPSNYTVAQPIIPTCTMMWVLNETHVIDPPRILTLFTEAINLLNTPVHLYPPTDIVITLAHVKFNNQEVMWQLTPDLSPALETENLFEYLTANDLLDKD
jgi:hypothetical protein